MFNAATYRTTDYGFFGPDSVSWKLWTAPHRGHRVPTFCRARTLRCLAGGSRRRYGRDLPDPQQRLDATLAYFVTVATADSKTTIELSGTPDGRACAGHRNRADQQ